MARCGCSGDSCSCKIIGGRGARVTGSGNINNPYIFDAFPMSLVVQDSPTVDLTMTGTGLTSDPWVISAELAAGALNDYWLLWEGSQAEYDALGSYDDQTLYLIT